jgi:excisionase family DNA binding protein
MNSDLTTAQVSERLGTPERTVRLWCKQGRFDGARPVDTPRGSYWLIPESALKNFEKPELGRPPKAQATNAIATPNAIDITLKLNKAFREATEAEEASQKKATKKGSKK